MRQHVRQNEKVGTYLEITMIKCDGCGKDRGKTREEKGDENLCPSCRYRNGGAIPDREFNPRDLSSLLGRCDGQKLIDYHQLLN
jgi:hypothetical protein